MEQAALFNKAYKIILSVLVFLIPLWFLPITQDVLNFQKQTLLIVLMLLAIIAWLAKSLSEGELSIRMSWLHVLVLAVILITGISTLTSLSRYASFWGWPLNVSDNFLTIFFFGLLYFLISSTIKDLKELFWLLYMLIASVAVAGIYAVLQLYNIFIFPFPFSRIATFNTIGNINGIAILSAILLPLALTIAFSLKSAFKWLFWFFTAIFLAILLLLNFFNAWLVLTIGLLVLLTFGMMNMKKKIEFGWISFPMAILIVSLFFMVFRVSLPGAPSLPLEVSPSIGAEFKITLNVLKHNPLLGSGPGTFALSYSKYHEPVVNQTIFWGTRFSSGASEIIDWFVTKGILGGLAILAVVIAAIIFAVQNLIKTKSDDFSWIIGVGILASFVSIAAAQSIYYVNFTIWFIFWLLLGAIGIIVARTQKKISIAPPSIWSVVSSFTFLLILIFGLGLLFVGGQKYAAEIQYLRGVQSFYNGNTDDGIAKILSAVQLNPSVDLYWRDLSQLYLSSINQVIANPNLSDDEKRSQNQVLIANAITAANKATEVSSENVANWNVRGFIYRNLIGIQGADAFAVASYDKAITLEPSSPFSFTELGRVYLAKAQSLASQSGSKTEQNEAFDKALENLNKAIELKQDYAPAHYLVAILYDQQGKSEEAIKKLEDARNAAPNDLGLAFQLGVLYYQRNENSKAKAEFERAKALNADYSNARYMLGLVYDRQGQKSRAIEEFTRVAELNPDNNQIRQIINNLNAGKSALSGIQLGSPPIQENPSEIQK